ncbi:MAG: carbohydrate-binding domain-containing protein [Phycisphaerae bacterium]|jgi:hypothetical protein
MRRALALGLLVCSAQLAVGEMVISEWMYGGADGEFVEFTNTGPYTVDMTGWSFDDDSAIPGTVDLSAFGVVEPGESVILTEATAVDFAVAWGLSGVAIIGDLSANLSRNDQINLYDAGDGLVDQLSYGDETYPGTPRAQNASCNIPDSDYGYTIAQTSWVLATVGDAYGSWLSAGGDVASPGRIVGYAPSDFDWDGDVDEADFDALSCCLAGPDVSYDPPPVECGLVPDAEGFFTADYDKDSDVDLVDFSVFQGCFSGADNPADITCGVLEEPHEDTYITLNGDWIAVDGSGVTVDGTEATITVPGTYHVVGTLDDGRIVVNAAGGLVQMLLEGVDITNSENAPVFVMSAGSVEVVLANQTVNYLTDATTYVYPDPEDPEPDAALFSKAPMTISGTGTLVVQGNYQDGIAGKDELIITGGTLDVTAVDDGIRGRDYLRITGGDFTIECDGDGLKATNDEDPLLGYITLEDGTYDITSGGDGIAAETHANISGGGYTLLCGGGHTVTLPTDVSAKGVKGLAGVDISGGTFDMDCADDGVHSNDTVTISEASLTIATNDNLTAGYGDGVHADNLTHIISGSVIITSCYEGIEGGNITIDDGIINVTSSNDAIDAVSNIVINGGQFTILSGGGHLVTIPSSRSAKAIKGLVSVTIGGGTFDIDAADDGLHSDNAVTVSGGDLTIATNSSTSASYGDGVHAEYSFHMTGGSINVTTAFEGLESRVITIDDGAIRVNTSDDGINAAGASGLNNYIHINGGYIAVYAQGDGIDANGHITMSGGTVIVHGPTGNFNGAIDYDGTFNISGGFLIAAGSAGMAQAPSTSSTQRSIKITYGSNKAAGTLAHLQLTNSPYTSIFTFAPSKIYRSVVFSSPALTQGTSYGLYTGGSCTGMAIDGLYTDGTYSGGTRTNTITTYNIVTNVYAP